MTLNPVTAQVLLLKCKGNEIWTVEDCREAGIPEVWIDELQDSFESGFDSDRNTIYKDGELLNQYFGVQDLHLAYKLAEYIGIDVQNTILTALSRTAEVAALKEALDEI